VVISHRRFGTAYRPHVQVNMGPIGCPETSVRYYPEKRSSHPFAAEAWYHSSLRFIAF